MAAKKKIAQEAGEVITTFKGFDNNLQCRGFQYAVGGEYSHDGDVAACSSGFHACEYPLDVLGYYAPAGSRFCIVEQSGQLSRHADDSKVASSKIKVTAEIGLPGLIKAAIEYTFKRSTPEGETATGDQGAASATGYRGAASATGYRGAASATGYQGAASATGTRGAASATGTQGAASATGTQGAASATGYQGAAMASGYEGRAMGKEGNALFLVERDGSYNIVAVWAGIAGRDGIKADCWYLLRNGKPVEA
jgi:hypothetical protein